MWRYVMEHYITKTKPPCPSNIKDFRPIALLNVEGKLFFSLISKRLVNHIITNNNLINTSVQKDCMDKVPGCWKHMSMVWSALKEAQSTKSFSANIWLTLLMLVGPFLTDCCFLLWNVMALFSIGFPLSKYTIQEFIVVLFLSLPQELASAFQWNFC